MAGFEGQCSNDENRERRSDVENSEDERRWSRIGTLKKKAMSASSRFTHSLKKRGKRKIDYRIPPVSIEDVRDAGEETAVHELRQKLVERGSLPPRHDDYHTLLRYMINSKGSHTNIQCCLLAHSCYGDLYFLLGFLKPGSLTLRRQFRCGRKCLRGERNMELILSLR